MNPGDIAAIAAIIAFIMGIIVGVVASTIAHQPPKQKRRKLMPPTLPETGIFVRRIGGLS